MLNFPEVDRHHVTYIPGTSVVNIVTVVAAMVAGTIQRKRQTASYINM